MGRLFALAALLALGCRGDFRFTPEQLKKLTFFDQAPDSVLVWPHQNLPEVWLPQDPQLVGKTWTDAAEIRVPMGSGDTIWVHFLAFRDALAAQSFLQESGLLRWGARWIRGDRIENCTRVGKVLVRFSHNRWRRPPERVFRTFLAQLPGMVEDSPFFALPLAGAMAGEATVQAGEFLGAPWDGALLIRRYRDSLGTWDIARSVEPASERDRQQWAERCPLQRGNGRVFLCELGEIEPQWIAWGWDRLGHLVVAWGPPEPAFLMARVALALRVGEWSRP